MEGIETRNLKIIYSKSGSGSSTSKISIPIFWLKDMNIEPETREIIAIYNYETHEITIKKSKNEKS